MANQRNEHFQTKIKELKKQNNELKSKMDDIKEMESEIDRLKEKVKQLTNKKEIYKNKDAKIDNTKYKTWDHSDILKWIFTLDNGKYKEKYGDVLIKSLEKNKIKGIELELVETQDIDDWGVVQFGDKKSLQKYIREIVTQNT